MMLFLLRRPRLYAALSGTLSALYHSQWIPTLIRFATKYHRSHSRRITVLRLKPLDAATGALPTVWLGLTQPVPPSVASRPPPRLQSTVLRSKCVPKRIEPGVVADPVSQPFGLQRNRSWPIKKLLPTVLPKGVSLLPS